MGFNRRAIEGRIHVHRVLVDDSLRLDSPVINDGALVIEPDVLRAVNFQLVALNPQVGQHQPVVTDFPLEANKHVRQLRRVFNVVGPLPSMARRYFAGLT